MTNQPIFAQQVFNNQLYLKLFGASQQSKSWLQLQAIAEKDQEQSISIHWSYLSSNFLILFRSIAFLILAYRFSIQPNNSFFNILVYLTQVGFNVTWIYFTLVCLDFILSKLIKSTICPKLGSWINLLYEIAICYQFPITIVYWSILFDYNIQHTSSQILKDFGQHGFPLVCLVIDFIFNVYVFPVKHLIVVILFGISYIIINLGYSLAISPVYGPIDWVSVMSYIWILACLIIVIVVHRGSHFVWTKYKKQKIEAIKNNSNQILAYFISYEVKVNRDITLGLQFYFYQIHNINLLNHLVPS